MIDHLLESGTDIKSTNELSDIISKDMKNYRFKFCGSITIYSFLEGIGIFNDHWEHCESRNPNIEKTVNGHFIGLSVSHDFYFVSPKKRDSYHIYVIFMLTLIFQLVSFYIRRYLIYQSLKPGFC